MLKLFVYGTLKPGEVNYQRYCAGKVVEAYPAIALGQLFDLPFGYPAMTSGHNPVYGYVLSFQDVTILRDLDELEDYDPERSPSQNEYERQLVEILNLNQQSSDTAWAYLMTVEQAYRLGGTPLLHGRWQGTSHDLPSS